MEELARSLMTVFEAQECVKKINENIQNTRALLLDLYERNGWEALGYQSWRECVVGEFKQHQSYLYRQLEAARAERNISVSPIGEIKESILRPLANLPPDEQREVYQKAVETAPEGKVTAKHIEKTIEARRPKLENYQAPAISERFNNAFKAMVEEIKRENLNGWKETEKATAKEMMAALPLFIKE